MASVRKSEGKKQFKRHRNRREDNAEIDLEKKELSGRYVLDLCVSGKGQRLDCCEQSNKSHNTMKCAS
jgi:hypothetical protein